MCRFGSCLHIPGAPTVQDQHRTELMADDATFAALRAMVPNQPHYMDRARRSGCRLVSEWNLLVPLEVLDRSWEEVV